MILFCFDDVLAGCERKQKDHPIEPWVGLDVRFLTFSYRLDSVIHSPRSAAATAATTAAERHRIGGSNVHRIVLSASKCLECF
jgi:hypothetical protein